MDVGAGDAREPAGSAPPSVGGESRRRTIPRIPAVHVVDVLAYATVIGLFVELFPSVISESFVITVLTAVLLKGVLEIVLIAKRAVVARYRASSTRLRKVTSALALLVVGPGSKFLVLQGTAIVFGANVYLGGFLQVTVLIVALMLTRALVRSVVV